MSLAGTTTGASFDAAEERLGPVSILVNNATGWRLADHRGPFKPATGAEREPGLILNCTLLKRTSALC